MSLAIAGGFYRESCSSPAWSEYYGSGGRAAACLQAFGVDRHLYTYASKSDLPVLKAIADTYDFSFKASPSEQAVSFDYLYPAAHPIIRPPLKLLTRGKPLRVDQECILRFGLLNGDAIVKGKKIVYDPQNAYQPELFAKNGSRAEKLAIVANRSEAAKLAQSNDLKEIGSRLLQESSVAAVVVKNGPWGAHVFTDDKYFRVPAYRTKRVFKIGSGDIFSAVFAFCWAVQGMDAAEAAQQASLATAFYCENIFLPLPPRSAITLFPALVVADDMPKRKTAYDVYLAAPFFNIKQIWLVEEVRRLLGEFGLKVFSPLHDVGRGPAEEVVQRDLDGIAQSRIVFACIDDLDAGTVFEAGYACARDIPVVAFSESTKEEDLKMLTGSHNCLIVRDLSTAIYSTVWQLIATNR